ncbi:Asp23/Gls24 family envelope stress response protein [Streptomyces ochraceiscleroticus]|uniref:Asp23/Gls24 family envelope stress response protein n=1 Tax=Streptomyces ochraceiscleroticus TaxID=47761 RepID=A0ABW1MNC4_9ACTN|nr:Asp23/Gls24 family envelope stress response protein [Streptomyces ochraceiscleroticus]
MAGQTPQPAVQSSAVQPPAVPPAQRGATRISDRVVAKIAAQAAREALRRGPDAVPRDGSGAHAADSPYTDDLAARDGAPDSDTPQRGTRPRDVRPDDARATVVVRRHNSQDTHGEAHVRIFVELGYPCDIGAECGAVRRQVTERVWALAGMTVPEVAVQVTRLHSPQLKRAGQGRVR